MKKLINFIFSALTVSIFYLICLLIGYPKMEPYTFVILVALVYIINKDELQ